MDIIVQYILSLVPAITSVIGMVVCIAVGISKIRKSNAEAAASVEKMKKIQEKQKEEILEYKTDIKNLESKLFSMEASLRKIASKVDHVHTSSKEK